MIKPFHWNIIPDAGNDAGLIANADRQVDWRYFRLGRKPDYGVLVVGRMYRIDQGFVGLLCWRIHPYRREFRGTFKRGNTQLVRVSGWRPNNLNALPQVGYELLTARRGLDDLCVLPFRFTTRVKAVGIDCVRCQLLDMHPNTGTAQGQGVVLLFGLERAVSRGRIG